MKSYKDFEKKYIGTSDIAALTVRSGNQVFNLKFGGDDNYDAYEVIGDAEIGSHYTKVFSGKHWLKIFDDREMQYNEYHYGMAVDIYRAGEMGCIIHWHEMDAE